MSFVIALSSMVQVADRPVTRQGLAGIKTQAQGKIFLKNSVMVIISLHLRMFMFINFKVLTI